MIQMEPGNKTPPTTNEATLPLAEVSWVGSSSLVIHMKLTRADDQVDVLKVTWKEGKTGESKLG